MKYLPELKISGRRVLLRVDFNVPLHADGSIASDARIRAALPSIKYIIKQGAALTIISHLGRPKGVDSAQSLHILAERLQELLNFRVDFVNQCVGKKAEEKSARLRPSQVLLLENLRFYAEEAAADAAFAKRLAAHGEVYVNDAFGTAHRRHTSTALLPQLFSEKGAGFLVEQELRTLEKVLKRPKRPLVAIIGGAKITDKIGILKHLIPKVDTLLVGGAMAHTFVHAMGGDVGDSLHEKDAADQARALQILAEQSGKKICLPTDVKIASERSNTALIRHVSASKIPNGWMGLDIGSETVGTFKKYLERAKTVLWNGPMGMSEWSVFAKGTEAIAASVAQATQNGCFSLVGGGDSVATLQRLGFDKQVSHLSTGGGALLSALSGEKLPALEALEGLDALDELDTLDA